MAAERSKFGPKKRCWTLFSGLQLLAVVAAGEAPDEVASVEDGAVSGGADRGGAESGTIGGENMALLLSLLGPDPLAPLVVADGDD